MSNPWLQRRVVAFAHRGGAREGPENTLWAMRRAVGAGATALETDVHATADGHLVVSHDPSLERTTGGRGDIAALTLAEVQRADNAWWFVPGEGTVHDRPGHDYSLRGRAPSDPELRVPTLDEVLSELPGVALNIDIKQTAPVVEPYEEALAACLREHGRSDDVIVASFDDRATEAFRSWAPAIATAAGIGDIARFVTARGSGDPLPALAHAVLQVPPAYAGTPIVDAEFVSDAHDAGLAVHVWTVDDEDQMRRLVDLGVDGIMSDRPSVLARVLSEMGVAWVP